MIYILENMIAMALGLVVVIVTLIAISTLLVDNDVSNFWLWAARLLLAVVVFVCFCTVTDLLDKIEKM